MLNSALFIRPHDFSTVLIIFACISTCCAFSSCTSLTQPIIVNDIFAFSPTSTKGKYSIPDGIKVICGGAFSSCSALTSIEIPSSVTTIGVDAFNSQVMVLKTSQDAVDDIIKFIKEGESFIDVLKTLSSILPGSCAEDGTKENILKWVSNISNTLSKRTDPGIAEILRNFNDTLDSSTTFEIGDLIRKMQHVLELLKVAKQIIVKNNNLNTTINQENMVMPSDAERTNENTTENEEKQSGKRPLVFISHSSADRIIVTALVRLLESIGLTKETLFCSSVPKYGIELGGHIFNTLRDRLQKHDLYVILVHSRNYYESEICMNEMGAAWIMQSDFCHILTKGIKYNDMKGVLDGSTICIMVCNDDAPDRLNQLKDNIIRKFGLRIPDQKQWDINRDAFIEVCKATEGHRDQS